MGWNPDHKHIWVLQYHVVWMVDGKRFVAAACACGRAGWKLAPKQQTQATEYS